MTISTGNIITHEGALQWGAGKVVDVTATSATIEFSDGKCRKIAASHFWTLHPADKSSYIPPEIVAEPVKATRASSAKKKK